MSFLAVPGRSIVAAQDPEAGSRLIVEKRPAIILIALGKAEAARHLAEMEVSVPEALVILVAPPRPAPAPPPPAGASGDSPATSPAEEAGDAPRPVPCLERGPDLAWDRKMLFPALGHLVAREEERLRLLEENRTLLLDLERGLRETEEKVAARTRELRDRIEGLQSENHAKTEFLSLISHKMRTPLTAIIGFAEIIASNIKEAEQDHDQMVQSILRSAMDLGNFLNDAIEFLQRSSGNLSLTRLEFDLIPHLQRVIRERTKAHASRRIRVAFRGLNAFRMVGDARSIASAIDRVLDNAFKFANTGDVVEVSLTEERRPAREGGPTMVLKVRDHGLGLHRHQIEKLFKPLEIYSSSPDRTLGHGLGLAITQEVIRSHGGRIHVESEGPDKGCLVTIELPMGFSGSAKGDRIPLGELVNGGRQSRGSRQSTVDS